MIGGAWRQSYFLVHGLRNFTNVGYYKAVKKWTDPGMQHLDATGRSFVVTGANAGLGKVTSLEIAKRGGKVHMLCRNKERGEAARDAVIQESGNQNVILHVCDVSQPKSIKAFAEEFKEHGHRCDCLINNAGAMIHPKQTTSDGLEMSFATNVLGTYLMTVMMAPFLKDAKGRVITVSSGGMYTQKMNVHDFEMQSGDYDGTRQYAQNKRCQVLMAERWASVCDGSFFSYSMHPGWSDTPGVQSAMPGFREKLEQKLRTIPQGADTIIWLALQPTDSSLEPGKFYFDRQVASFHFPLSFTSSSTKDVNKLFQKCKTEAEKIIGSSLDSAGSVATGVL